VVYHVIGNESWWVESCLNKFLIFNQILKFHCKYDIVFVQFLLCFLYVFFYNKACN
jgi:hypothetical protein